MILNQSLAKAVFLGEILEENLFQGESFAAEESETLRLVLDSIDRFLQGKSDDFRRFDTLGEQPQAYLEELKNLGLFGLIIPEEYGGIGLSNSAYARVIQQTSSYDASTSLTIGAHSSIGMKGLLLFGTAAQKQKYLPRLSSGEMIAAFCLTEPGAGSDAASIRTVAEKQADGSWVLNGEKIWITNGAFADFFTVFARTSHTAGQLSAFIVERSYAGVRSGPKEDKLGIRASATTSVFFENVRLPAENLLGEEGKGFKIAMEILNNGRTGLGGGCVGGMKASIARAVQQASERKQFGKAIAEFGLVKEKIAQMTVDCFAAESVVGLVGHYIDSAVQDYSIEAACSKVFCSEAMWRCAYEAQQIAGGNGYMKEFPYERVLRDCRINMIFEGTNEILRLYVALSGMKEAGRYLKDVSQGFENIFNDPIKGFGLLSGYATKKITQYSPISRERVEGIHPDLAFESSIFAKAVTALSRAAEALLRRHGKGIVEEQLAMKRVADVAIDIVVGLSVLARVSGQLQRGGEPHLLAQAKSICRLFALQARRRIKGNLRRVELDNEDQEVKSLADFILEEKKYPWDLL